MPDFADTVVPAFIIALIAQRESLVAHLGGWLGSKKVPCAQEDEEALLGSILGW